MIQWAEIKVNLQMAVKNIKICPYCNSKHTKKDGTSYGVQRYKSNDTIRDFVQREDL